MMADCNGDGQADVVGFGTDGVYVALAKTGTIGFYLKTQWSSEFDHAAGWVSQNETPRLMADVNDDGMADVVGFAPEDVYVALSTGSGFVSKQPWRDYWGKSSAGWTDQNYTPRMMGDPNGDGKQDVVGFANYGGYSSPAEE